MSKNTLFNRAFGGFSFVQDDYVRQCKIIVADYQKRCAKINKDYAYKDKNKIKENK